MKLTIEISCYTDAFCPEPSEELAAILRYAARRIEDMDYEFPIYDSNGNKCGTVTWEGDDDGNQD